MSTKQSHTDRTEVKIPAETIATAVYKQLKKSQNGFSNCVGIRINGQITVDTDQSGFNHSSVPAAVIIDQLDIESISGGIDINGVNKGVLEDLIAAEVSGQESVFTAYSSDIKTSQTENVRFVIVSE